MRARTLHVGGCGSQSTVDHTFVAIRHPSRELRGSLCRRFCKTDDVLGVSFASLFGVKRMPDVAVHYVVAADAHVQGDRRQGSVCLGDPGCKIGATGFCRSPVAGCVPCGLDGVRHLAWGAVDCSWAIGICLIPFLVRLVALVWQAGYDKS